MLHYVFLLLAVLVLVFQIRPGREAFEFININHAKNNGITSTSSRIVGGTQSHWATSYPWFVRLNPAYNTTNTCGGSLITRDCVLTAAHCVENTKPSKVRIGQNEIRNVSRVVMHPDFDTNKTKAFGDIALIFLEKPSSKAPVRLLSSAPKKGSKVTIIGFGKTTSWTPEQSANQSRDPDAYYGSSTLQKSRVTVTDYKGCGVIHAQNENMKKIGVPDRYNTLLDFVCLKSDSSTACNGDSGGPAILWQNDRPYVFGVTSNGIPGCIPWKKYGYTMLYTDINKYRGWIGSMIKRYGKHNLRI